MRSRRRTIALVVGRDATLTVRAPHSVSLAYIEELINGKRAWILYKQAEMLKRGVIREKIYVHGEKFLFLGKEYSLRIYDGIKIAIDDIRDEILFPEQYLSSAQEMMKRWYKKQAAGILGVRLRVLMEKTGWKCESMKITSAVSRWGSCTNKNAINFSWRLIMARPSAIEYVIVHELAHTVEHNHSSRFWHHVSSVFPSYKIEEKWLKENSGRLRL